MRFLFCHALERRWAYWGILFLILALPSAILAQTSPAPTPAPAVAAPPPDDGTSATGAKPQTAAPVPKERLRIIKGDKLEAAGQDIGNRIEAFGTRASGRVGGWINAKVFYDISWMKLLVCLIFVLAVVVLERLATLFFRKRRFDPAAEDLSWRDYLINALSRPAKLFIWVYGLYASLTPLYAHFKSPHGVNLVQDVAQRSADIAAAVALVWFFYRLVDYIDARLKQCA